MSNLELNKISAAVLLSTLITVSVGFVSNILYKPKLDLDQRGYQVDMTSTEPANKHASFIDKTTDTLDINKIMKNANAEAGAKIIKKCIACHSLNQGGVNKVGPNLWRVVNAKKGVKPGYAYSKAMIDSGGVWDHESLFYFLQKPSKFMPGTKMSFAGIKESQDIADIVAYLEENSRSASQ